MRLARSAQLRGGVVWGAGRPALSAVPRRFLNIHEWQSKELCEKYGVRVQKFRVVTDPKAALKAASELEAKELVVKAQVHAGGRGKGHFDNGFKGGVHLCNTAEEASELTGKMLGHKLITNQTGEKGVEVKSVMVAEAINITKEAYFSILLDRAYNGPVLVASPDGGMDIEAVAEKTPDRIAKEAVDIVSGPSEEQLQKLARFMGFAEEQVEDAATQLQRLYDVFIASDATQVEVNPLAATDTGEVYVADAKLNFDDNAAFRQKEIFDYRDTNEEDAREVDASKYNLNYIAMDGNIGCMVNGAGLAMATMDIIQLYGGSPANFLDVGGSANANQITQAFRIITSDPQVKAVLVNIFGGIMRCDVIAEGIIEAAKNIKLEVPLVVRLAGTNVERGQQLLKDSGLPIITAKDLDDAAVKSVKALQ